MVVDYINTIFAPAQDVFHTPSLFYFISLLSKYTNQPIKKITEDLKRTTYMSASEALSYGIIDSIIGESDEKKKQKKN